MEPLIKVSRAEYMRRYAAEYYKEHRDALKDAALERYYRLRTTVRQRGRPRKETPPKAIYIEPFEDASSSI